MALHLRTLIFLLYCMSAAECQTETNGKAKLYRDEEDYFLRFKSHRQREEYLQCIMKNGTNIIFYGNYTKYGHILRTNFDCFKQPELDDMKFLQRVFRDYETLKYYLDGEYHKCFNGTEATFKPNLTSLKEDFHVSIKCLGGFRVRMENFQVKSYLWVKGFEMTLLAVLLVLGVPANAALLLVLWRNKEMHTTANIFIANLAVADLMNIMVYAPLSFLHYVQFDESYGDIICKFIMSACDLFMIVSVYTFICMSAYRYMGIRSLVSKSKSRRMFTKRGAIVALVLVWVTACGLCYHSAMGAGVVANHCFFRLSHSGYIYRRITEILVIFLVPFVTITYFCVATAMLLHRSASDIPGENQDTAIASRKRSANIPIALIIQFFVCHFFRLTFLVIDLWSRYSYYSGVNQGLFCFLLLYFTFSAFLTYFHSCLPPVMLFFTSSNVRGYFKASLKTWFRLDGDNKPPVVAKKEMKKRS